MVVAAVAAEEVVVVEECISVVVGLTLAVVVVRCI